MISDEIHHSERKNSRVPRIARRLVCRTSLEVGERTLPEANIAPEHGWLEDKPFLFWDGFLAGAMIVSGTVCEVENQMFKKKCSA